MGGGGSTRRLSCGIHLPAPHRPAAGRRSIQAARRLGVRKRSCLGTPRSTVPAGRVGRGHAGDVDRSNGTPAARMRRKTSSISASRPPARNMATVPSPRDASAASGFSSSRRARRPSSRSSSTHPGGAAPAEDPADDLQHAAGVDAQLERNAFPRVTPGSVLLLPRSQAGRRSCRCRTGRGTLSAELPSPIAGLHFLLDTVSEAELAAVAVSAFSPVERAAPACGITPRQLRAKNHCRPDDLRASDLPGPLRFGC